MNRVVVPRTVVPDSSTLAGMAKDFETEARRERLQSVLEALEEQSVVLVLTFQQVVENLRYLDEAAVDRRLRFLIHLSNRPNVGWIQSRATGGMGSIVDVVAAEVEACLRSPGISFSDLIVEVRGRLFRFGSLPTDDLLDLHTLRRFFAAKVDREREVASLAFGGFFDPGVETVGELRRANARSREGAARFLRGLTDQLASNLRKGGDKKLRDPDRTAARFLDEVASELPVPEDGESPVDAILRYAGLRPEEVPDDTPWSEVSSLAVFRTQMKVVKRVLDVPDHEVDSLDPARLPSFRVQEGLRKRVSAAHRRRGGDLGDAHLAVLVWYFDYVVVDGRTHEYLTQMRRQDPEATALMGKWVKHSDYTDLPLLLRECEPEV